MVDASKSVVPGASVTATNIAMGTAMSAVTNQDGFFQIPYLIPGAYKVTVELSGFKKWVRETVDVRVADRLELEVALEVGGTVEEVTVSADDAAARDRERARSATSSTRGASRSCRRRTAIPTR